METVPESPELLPSGQSVKEQPQDPHISKLFESKN